MNDKNSSVRYSTSCTLTWHWPPSPLLHMLSLCDRILPQRQIYTNAQKVKVTPWQAYVRTENRCRYSLDLFATLVLRGGGWSAPCPATLAPGKMQYPLYRNLDGPQGWSGQTMKNITPTDSIPRFISIPMVMHDKIKACGSVKITPYINFGTRCVYMLRHVLTGITPCTETSCSPDSFVVMWKREYFSNAYAKNWFLTVLATVQRLTDLSKFLKLQYYYLLLKVVICQNTVSLWVPNTMCS